MDDSKPLYFKVTREIRDELDRRAREVGMSTVDIVRMMIISQLKNEGFIFKPSTPKRKKTA